MEPSRLFSRPRFSIRRLMVAVAIVALLVWSATVAMRWVDCRRRAEHHEEIAGVLSSEIAIIRENGGSEEQATMREALMADENRQARRFRRAMQRPWLPVAPE